MKSLKALLLFSLLVTPLFCMEIPFSTVPVKTDANLVTNLVRIDPDDQTNEPYNTRFWLWYDENNLYAEIESKWDSRCTTGRLSGRDNGSNGDYVYIALITNPESYSNYFYGFTPNGSLADGTRSLKDGSGYNWNSSYTYTSSINDSIWKVFVKIPFCDLRFKANPPYNWKIKLTHYYEENKDYYVYPYYSESQPKEYYDKALPVTLTQKIKKRSNWKYRPYYIKSYDLIGKTDSFDPNNIGLDISFNPGSWSKLKIAVNPDYTDVPPDNAQDIYNNKYPTYNYSENRFFFIEDIDAFNVDENMFYTRNIEQPQYAVKFTGSADTWSYGYLCAKDKAAESGNLSGTDDFYQLMSVKKTEDRYSASISAASKLNKGYYNHFINANWEWEYLKNLHAGTSQIYTMWHNKEAEAGSDKDLHGLYQALYLSATPNNWDIYAQYTNIPKDTRMDMGYFYDTNMEKYQFVANYSSNPVNEYLRQWSYMTSLTYSDWLSTGHPLKYTSGSANLSLYFLPKYSLYAYITRGREEYCGYNFDVYRAYISGNWYKWNKLRMGANITYGETVIYNLIKAKAFYSVNGHLTGDLNRNLSWSADVTHIQYDYNKITYVPLFCTDVYLDNAYQICNLTLKYNFSNQMSVSNGLGISTYQRQGKYSDLSFYSNFRYEFKKDMFIYIGYKTGQNQDEPTQFDDITGHFIRNSASSYLKLSATL